MCLLTDIPTELGQIEKVIGHATTIALCPDRVQAHLYTIVNVEETY